MFGRWEMGCGKWGSGLAGGALTTTPFDRTSAGIDEPVF